MRQCNIEYKQLRQCDACKRFICSSLNGVRYERVDKDQYPMPTISTVKVNDDCRKADWELQRVTDVHKSNYE